MIRSAAFAAAALLAGCATLRPEGAHETLPLLAPATLGATVQAEQVLRAAHADRSVTLQCMVDIATESIALSCFTALGQRAFTLQYDGHELVASNPEAGADALPPQRVLSDLQLAYWPLPILQAAVAGRAWQITEPAPGTRRVRHGTDLYAEVHYTAPTPWDGRLWLVNFADDYSLSIESRQAPQSAAR